MRRKKLLVAICIAIGMAVPAAPDIATTEIGGDTFAAGESLLQTFDADRDVFAAGRSATVLGRTAGDLHVSGFDVKVDADVAEDVYAAGATVTIAGAVAKDLTAAGFTVRLDPGAQVGENARLAGGTVTVEAPIAGALSATGRDIMINAAIAGDVRLFAKSIRFGPKAKIAGRLTYSAAREIEIPDSVIAKERVRFEPANAGKFWKEVDQMREMPVFPTFASLFFGFLISLLFFIVLGAIALAFIPKRLEAMRGSISDAFGQTALIGVLGLSLLFGAVPIVALTIVGIPFVPILVLSIIVAWTLAYALGAYAIATRLWFGLGGDEDPGMIIRLLIFAVAIVVIALLNFIPFVGWVANYTLVLLGLGAITRTIFEAIVGSPEPALDQDLLEPDAE